MPTSEAQLRLIRRRRENNLCLNCAKPLDRKGSRCIACNEELNKENREKRKWYKEHRICPRCFKNDLFGDENVCLECGAYAYEIALKSKERLGKEHCNKVHAEWQKRTHKEMIAKGICTRCRKRNADSGFKTCSICRARDNEKRRARNFKEDRSKRAERGLCYFCDNPVKEGYKVCEYHYERNSENARSQNSKNARKKLIKEGILY